MLDNETRPSRHALIPRRADKPIEQLTVLGIARRLSLENPGRDYTPLRERLIYARAEIGCHTAVEWRMERDLCNELVEYYLKGRKPDPSALAPSRFAMLRSRRLHKVRNSA
jgi:hypothetical protein